MNRFGIEFYSDQDFSQYPIWMLCMRMGSYPCCIRRYVFACNKLHVKSDPRGTPSFVSGTPSRWCIFSGVGRDPGGEGEVRGDVYKDRHRHGRPCERSGAAGDLPSEWPRSASSRTHMVSSVWHTQGVILYLTICAIQRWTKLYFIILWRLLHSSRSHIW